MVDTSTNQLILPKHGHQIPLKLSNKGLYLVDMNMLLKVPPQPRGDSQQAETFAQESWEKKAVETSKATGVADDQSGNPVKSKSIEEHEKIHVAKPPANDTNMSNTYHTHENHHIAFNMTMPMSTHPPIKSDVKEPIAEKGSSETQAVSRVDHREISLSQHERLGQTSSAPSGGHASDRDGVCRPSEPRGLAEREGEVWKGLPREDVCRGVGDLTGVGQVVPGPLPGQFQCGAQESDQVHQVEDRGGRDAGLGHIPDASPSKAQAGPKVTDHSPPKWSTSTSRCSPRRTVEQSGGECLGGPNDQSRERIASDSDAFDTIDPKHDRLSDHERGSPGASSGFRMGRSVGCLDSEDGDRNWALSAGEIDEFSCSISNQERDYFQSLVIMMEKELAQSEKRVSMLASKLNLIEVFCSDQSTLTEQVNQLGGKAMRFGLRQGDLQQPEGRRKLFDAVCRHRPEHVWVSPTCKPWSKWSTLNSQKSVELWDRIHAERQDMLCQVALCLVLCRYQHRCSRHAHWEQPGGSLMFQLPYLSELMRYMLSARPDMCTAGNLQDPENGQFMKKGMHILTSSRTMYELLDPLRCKRDHCHQPIEGSTRVHGLGIARSTFSERYPRKFARLIAKSILKRKFPTEKLVGTLVDHALAAMDQWFTVCSALAVETRRTKRPKLSEPRQAKAKTADRSLDTAPTVRRQRVSSPETTGSREKPQDEIHEEFSNQVTKIMDTIIPLLPRVGKKVIDDPRILQLVQEMFPEKIIRAILACKGTERTMAPPENIRAREAPFRRAIMKLRSSGKIITDDWEKYDELSKRRIIRKSFMNITVFAANPMQVPQSTSSTEAGVPLANGSAEMPFSRMESPPSSMDPNMGVKVPEETHERTVPGETKDEVVNEVPMHGSPIQMDPGASSAKGNRFLSLPREEQAMLRRAHQNLCHPSPEQLSTVLRMQGARPEITQAVFDMKCATCASQQLPRIARPSTLKHELDFNDKVFIDGVTWTSKLGKTFHFYHMLDQATNYHVAAPAPSRAAEQASQCVAENWFQWAGPPNVLMTDAGTEFTSEHFMEFLQKFDVKPVTVHQVALWV